MSRALTSLAQWFRLPLWLRGVRPFPGKRRVWSARPALEPLEMRLTPSVFAVTNTLDDGSTGSLRWAVQQANAAGGTNTIDFEGPVFTTPQTIKVKNGWLPLNNGTTTIQGPGVAMLTLSGNFGRVFYVFDFATATITGLTISKGNVFYAGQPDTGSGGAIYNRGVLTVSDCTFSNNSANGSTGYGGAIYSARTLTVSNCLFSGNTASTDGGAIYENTTFGTTVTGCTFTSNTAGTGGGAIYSGGTLAVSGCTFGNNSVYAGGGGILTGLGSNTTITGSTFTGNSATATFDACSGGGVANNGTMAVSGCTFSGNSAGGGGGIVNFGPLTVTNCTFSGNTTTQNSGGAIYTDHPVTVTCSTLSGNSATYGGGIFNNSSANAPVTLYSSIVAANTAPNGPDVYGPMQSASSYDLIGNGAAMFGISSGSNHNQVGSAASPINPLLAPLGLYGGTTQTRALLPGSPALGAGNPNATDPGGNVITTDQRGVARTVNGRTDVGAFESQGFTLTTLSGSGQTAPVATAFTNPLVVQVAPAATGEPVAGGLVTFSGPGSGAGLAPPTTVVTIAANGQASLTATANTAAGSYQVTANAVGAAGPVGFNLTNTAGAADHLAFLVQPGHGVAQIPLYPPVQVQIFDAYGNPLTADNSDQLTLTVASGPGAFTAGSTTTVTVSGGIATFSNLALAVEGTYTLGETGTGGLTGPNSNSFTIDPLTPIALSQNPQINGALAALAGAQRSMVDDIVYTFNHAVSLSASAFTIALHAGVTVNGNTGQTVGTLPTLSWSSPDGGVTWVVTFSGAGVVGGSIADGVYDITLNHAAVTDAPGQALAADRVDTFYRLYGDTNGDQSVNGTDYFQFKNAYGTSSGQSGYLAYLDYNADGLINGTDYFQFKQRYGMSFSGFTPTI
jgi:predicted outer membrane repeat protein